MGIVDKVKVWFCSIILTTRLWEVPHSACNITTAALDSCQASMAQTDMVSYVRIRPE